MHYYITASVRNEGQGWDQQSLLQHLTSCNRVQININLVSVTLTHEQDLSPTSCNVLISTPSP